MRRVPGGLPGSWPPSGRTPSSLTATQSVFGAGLRGTSHPTVPGLPGSAPDAVCAPQPDELVAELLGVTVPAGDARRVGTEHLTTVSDPRLLLALFAQVAADREHVMDVHTWRNPDSTAGAWLVILNTSIGYGLSEVEDRVVGALFGRGDPELDAGGQDDTAADTATEGDQGA